MLEAPITWNDFVMNDRSRRTYGVIYDGRLKNPQTFGIYAHDDQWWIRVTSVDGMWDADVRDDRQALPLRSGEVSGLLLYGGKTITISGEVRASNVSALRRAQRELQVAFSGLDYGTLKFRTWIDSDVLYVRAKKVQPLTMSEQQSGPNFVRSFAITLRADDPRAYSIVERTLSVDSDAFGATVMSRQYPRKYDIAGVQKRRKYSVLSGQQNRIVNNGTAETYPISRISGPITNPILKNVSTGEQLSWSGLALGSGRYLLVDHGEGTILLDGATPYFTGFDALSSTFWAAQPGQNDVSILAYSNGASASWDVSWHDAYR